MLVEIHLPSPLYPLLRHHPDKTTSTTLLLYFKRLSYLLFMAAPLYSLRGRPGADRSEKLFCIVMA